MTLLKKLLVDTKLVFISFVLFTYTFLSGVVPLQAEEIIFANDKNQSMDIAIEDSAKTIEESKKSSEPDLGDDQTFPFIPGFGKNSGKD
tara:strand:+ start:738 stop:1004 length:267 start_codon:yes stop_codon:yes gene_type:complete